MNGIVGRKLGMTRLFDEEGRALAVTVIEAGPCPVLQVRTNPSGRVAVQLGFGSQKAKRTNKAEAGHAKKANLEAAPHVLKEFSLPTGSEAPKQGDTV